MPAQQWGASQGDVDAVDQAAISAARKWGVGRLRLLVAAGLREKFDRQRVRLNDAIAAASADGLRTECRRMLAAYAALDAAAVAAGAQARPDAWEIVLDDNTILTFVRSDADAARFPLDGFKREVWGLDEVAKLIAMHPEISAVKRRFGAHVESIRRAVEEPVPATAGGDFPHVDLDDVFGSQSDAGRHNVTQVGSQSDAERHNVTQDVTSASADPQSGFE